MSRRVRIPDRDDVTPGLVPPWLGLSAADFEAWRPELERRGYCIEATDPWRLRRHPKPFADLTGGQQAVHAETVLEVRLRRFKEKR
jgi:hypothetical protein